MDLQAILSELFGGKKMPKRSKNWNENFSKQPGDLKYAGGFLLALLDDGEPLQEALGATIRAFGVKEFAELVNLKPSTIQRVISLNSNPTKKTLEKLLKPFGFVLGAMKVPSRKEERKYFPRPSTLKANSE